MADQTDDMPLCPNGHGPMHPRPAALQTPEQQWCGAWFDCHHCKSSVLIKSAALDAHLSDAARLLGARGGAAGKGKAKRRPNGVGLRAQEATDSALTFLASRRASALADVARHGLRESAAFYADLARTEGLGVSTRAMLRALRRLRAE